MSAWAVIVAAGSGQRLGSETPKVLYPLAGKELIDWTLTPFDACGRVEGICLVTTPTLVPVMEKKLAALGKPGIVVTGGADRGSSVKAGLSALPEDCRWVLVHDGARPCLTTEDLEKLLDRVEESGSAVAGYPARDTLHLVDSDNCVKDTPDRSGLWTVQTPQCFDLKVLLAAHEAAAKENLTFTDDAALYRWAGHRVSLVETRSDNLKLTTREDIPVLEAILGKREKKTMRIGTGYDVHQLVEGRKLIIGGVDIPHEKGLDGHSDADVLAHAIMDSLLGAAKLGDIGLLFPPTDPAYKGADSLLLLREVMVHVRRKGFEIENVDATVVAQRPKLMPHRKQMEKNLARAMGIDTERISVKATTTEKLGFEGRQEGISAQAAALLREV